jgi:hypothetical protein
MSHLRAKFATDQKLVEQGMEIARTGITRTFPPQEIQRMTGLETGDFAHRLYQGELEYRASGDTEWVCPDPWDLATDFSTLHSAAKAQKYEALDVIKTYIHQRLAIEGAPAMIPEPEPEAEPEIDTAALRRTVADEARAARTLRILTAVTNLRDWEGCEDGTLQGLIFDTRTLADLLPVAGSLAESMARRLKADEVAGVTPPPQDTKALLDYKALLEKRIPEIRRWRRFSNEDAAEWKTWCDGLDKALGQGRADHRAYQDYYIQGLTPEQALAADSQA